MATERILHPEFRDENNDTNYPFADLASLANADGLFLPQEAFLDAIFYVVGAGAELRLSQVVVTNSTVTFYVGDANDDALAETTFDLLVPPDCLRFVDGHGRPAGLIVASAEQLAIFQSWPLGTHAFTRDQSQFAATCCTPMPEVGVRGFLLDDGTLLTGDVWLVGDAGVVLSAAEETIQRPGILGGPQTCRTIRVDVVGDPLFRRRLCQGVFATPPYLQQIKVQYGGRCIVCKPDAMGDFQISVGHHDAADTILRIRATTQGLLIEAVGETLQGVM